MEELLEYDIESILLNRSKDIFPYHQKLTAICDAFLSFVSNTVKQERVEKNYYTDKIENNANVIADLTSQVNDIQNECTNIALQQKVLEKQINITLQKHEEIQSDVVERRSQEENYALEIADLEQEMEENKRKKKLKWDGIKRACLAYKSALQFYIQIIDSSEVCDEIRIVFFKPQKDDNPEYYVDLSRTTADVWKVEHIHPSLKPKHKEQLQCVVNFKKQQQLSNITAFLCLIRKIFKEQLNT